MPKLPAVAVALLAALPLAGLHGAADARADGATFALPPFHIGDFATYNDSKFGIRNISIGGPVPIMDKSMRMVDAITVTYSADGVVSLIQYFSPRAMTLEADYVPCASERNSDGSCALALESRHWYVQGTPAIMGATYLQGRSFHIGDSWNLTGECSECTWRSVTIESPNGFSPPGTDFVANVRGDYVDTAFKGRIHMNASSAFPLRVEEPWGHRILVNQTRGSAPISPPTPPEDTTYTSLLPILPFHNRRPVEGTPIPGWPSWSDARNASGPDDAEMTPGSVFVSLEIPSPFKRDVWLNEPFPRVAASVRDFEITSRYAVPGQGDNVTKYFVESVNISGLQSPMVYQGATRSMTSATTRLCADSAGQRSVALWDTVRIVRGFPYLHDFEGFTYRQGLNLRTDECIGTLLVTGEFHAPPGGFLVSEHVSISAHEGYLRYAETAVHS